MEAGSRRKIIAHLLLKLKYVFKVNIPDICNNIHEKTEDKTQVLLNIKNKTSERHDLNAKIALTFIINTGTLY